jgi:hypothetical protein
MVTTLSQINHRGTSTKRKKRAKESVVSAFGKEFPSLNALSNDTRCKVTAATLKNRIKLGYTPEEAATMLPLELAKGSGWYRQRYLGIRKDTNLCKASRFFVYVFCDPRTMAPIYIGKGTGKRISDHLRRYQTEDTMFYRKLRKMASQGIKPYIYKVVEGVNEETAYEWEAWLIKHFGRKIDGGSLYNLSEGGGPEIKAKSVNAFGETFSSCRCLADDARCVVSYSNLRARIRLGWEPEPAASTPSGAKRAKQHMFFGEQLSLKQVANHPRCLVPMQTLRNRLSVGWTAEEAATTKEEEPHVKTVYAFGKDMTVRQIVDDKRCIVSRGSLEHRISMGWDAQQAATTPKRDRNMVAFGGKEYTVKKLSKDPRCVVPYERLWQRLKDGWSVMDAMTTPYKVERSTGERVEVFGESIRIIDLAKDSRCVVGPTTLRYRLKTGWKPEEAVTTPAGRVL